MEFEFLFQPVEAIDHWLSGMLDVHPCSLRSASRSFSGFVTRRMPIIWWP